MNKQTTIHIARILAALGILAMAGCPAPQDGQGADGSQQAATTQAPAEPAVSVCLVRTDLGLGDGEFVREADGVLSEMAGGGFIIYQPVGDAPEPMIIEASDWDIGLPAPAALDQPGAMQLAEAEELLAQAGPCDWLVLAGPDLLPAALARIETGELEAQLVLLLDQDGMPGLPEETPVPLVTVRYRIKDVAFLLGVAAAQSANNGQFVAMAAETDPQAEEFLDAVSRGAKYQTNGAVTFTATLPVDEESGLVTPEIFRIAHDRIREEAGNAFAANHYIFSLGRTTPTTMYAMTQEPIKGYVLGAYADFRQLRPARVVGCALKKPGSALRHLFDKAQSTEELVGLADGGYIELGLEQDAVGFTGFELYSRYNPDGEDIMEAVDGVRKLIEVDELGYNY